MTSFKVNSAFFVVTISMAEQPSLVKQTVYPNLKINVSTTTQKRKVSLLEQPDAESESFEDMNLRMTIHVPPKKKRKYLHPEEQAQGQADLNTSVTHQSNCSSYSRVQSEEPENAELRSLRARAQLLARRSAAALRDTRWLHARVPSNFEIATLHAAALVGAGEIEEAHQAYEEL